MFAEVRAAPLISFVKVEIHFFQFVIQPFVGHVIKITCDFNENLQSAEANGHLLFSSDFSSSFSGRNLKVFFSKKKSLIKLNKEELVTIALSFQGKFNFILNGLKRNICDLKNNLSGLKSGFPKLKANIQVTKNINTKLSDRLVTIDSRCYVNEQFSRRECLKTSGTPTSVANNGLR